ncbi:MAG: hypothetical protein ABF289_19140 [Clostridiales bacterium]
MYLLLAIILLIAVILFVLHIQYRISIIKTNTTKMCMLIRFLFGISSLVIRYKGYPKDKLILSKNELYGNFFIKIKIFGKDFDFKEIEIKRIKYLENFLNLIFNEDYIIKNIMKLRKYLIYINKFLNSLKPEKFFIDFNISSYNAYTTGIVYAFVSILKDNIDNTKINLKSNKFRDMSFFDIRIDGERNIILIFINLCLLIFEMKIYEMFKYMTTQIRSIKKFFS